MLKKTLLLAATFGLQIAFSVVAGLLPSAQVLAQTYKPISPNQLKTEIDLFAQRGADAYFVWQYSGDRGTGQEFGNDQYSFFRNIDPGPAICEALLEKHDELREAGNPMILGVNMWDAGDPKHSQAKLEDHFNYLKTCGVEGVRVFAKAGEADGMRKVLKAAQATDMKIIIAIGDYSNGGGGIPKGAGKDWYESGYQGDYMTLVRAIVGVVNSGFRDRIYALELANEPHCGGDASAIGAYTNWGRAVGAVLQGASNRVGYGQMSSHNETRCDSPGPGDFATTNNISPITMTSGHYYNQDERTLTLEAMAQVPGGKKFYIGEAGWGGAEELEPAPYYLNNIKGLSAGDATTILNDLIDQGYETHCTTPEFKVEAVTGGDLSKFMELLPILGIETQTLRPTATFDYTGSEIPILRDSDVSPSLYASLEDFWGFRNPLRPTFSDVDFDISSSPVYTLLSPVQQCQFKVNLLETIEDKCNQLEDPSSCALYQPITGADGYTTRSVLDDWRASGLGCFKVANGEYDEDQRPLVEALDKTPLYLEKSYRLAFLVITAELKEDDGGFFSFLRPPSEFEPRDEVRIIAFKVPDFGANQYLNDPNVYQDPLKITRDVISSQEAIALEQAEAAQARENLRSSGAADSVIKCGNDEVCTDPLSKALISMVNKNGQQCKNKPEDLKYEPAEAINSPGSLTSSEGTQFADGNDPALELFTAPADQINQPQIASFNFLSNIRIGATGDSDTTMNAYLVYPVGHDLTTVEDSLLAWFNTTWQEQQAQNPDLKKYFKLNGVQQVFSGGTATRTFFDPNDSSKCRTDEITGVVTCDPYEVEAEIQAGLGDNEPRILGGYLGFLSRMVATQMASFRSQAHTFLMSCRTTQDFLTGNCGKRNPTDPSDPGDELPGVGGLCIETFVEPAQAQTYANQLRTNLPNQENRSNSFAGWQAYYAGYLPGGTQYLFDTCGGQTNCYEYVINQAVAAGINPYLAVAIALNETGGLKSTQPDGTGPHFGCGIDHANPGYISNGTIENKLACMLGFFKNNEGLDANAALTRYGYANGYNNQNLNTIIEILSQGSYQGQCSGVNPTEN